MARPRTRDRDLFDRVVPVRRGRAEDAVQAAVVEYVRRCYPEVMIWHCPNGGWRGSGEAARFKWLGVLAGMPDLGLTWHPRGVAFWEIKDPIAGRLSDAQLEVIERLSSQGHLVTIVTSIDDARRELAALGLVSREAPP